jgi:putative nucleotidyltransferase with HDIG domain
MTNTILTLHNELLDMAESVPPLPSTVTRLAVAVADEDSELEDITSIVRDDPLVVAALLREANSAASAPASEIVTVEAAIMRLGMARVLAVATDTGVTKQTREELAAYQLGAGELWDHSTRASYVAEAVYKLDRSLTGPEVVTAALLHDVGQILLDKILDPVCFNEARSSHDQITMAERELVEIDHAELGAVLLELWGIPLSISDAVRNHHQPEFGESAMPYVVSIADLSVHEIYETRPLQAEQNRERLDRCLAEVGLERDAVLTGARKLLLDYGHLVEADGN